MEEDLQGGVFEKRLIKVIEKKNPLSVAIVVYKIIIESPLYLHFEPPPPQGWRILTNYKLVFVYLVS